MSWDKVVQQLKDGGLQTGQGYPGEQAGMAGPQREAGRAEKEDRKTLKDLLTRLGLPSPTCSSSQGSDYPSENGA